MGLLIPSEHDEQVTLIQLLRLELPELESMTTAVPHGGLRKKGVAGQLKAEGVKKGYPDLLIDYPRGPYHGARIELKRRVGAQATPEQWEWINALNDLGYFAWVCKGADAAMEQLRWYWALGPYSATTPPSTSGPNGAASHRLVK